MLEIQEAMLLDFLEKEGVLEEIRKENTQRLKWLEETKAKGFPIGPLHTAEEFAKRLHSECERALNRRIERSHQILKAENSLRKIIAEAHWESIVAHFCREMEEGEAVPQPLDKKEEIK